jgi:hypothetical protein
MLQPLCVAWYLTVASVGIERSLPPPVRPVPPLLHAVHALPLHVAQQGGVTPASRRVRVQFASGRSSASLAGHVQGSQIIEYVLSAHTQQRLAVRLTSTSPFLLMGLYAPTGEALCVETCNSQWTGLLPHLGDYTIRVGLVRAEARRQGRAHYRLHVHLTAS